MQLAKTGAGIPSTTSRAPLPNTWHRTLPRDMQAAADLSIASAYGKKNSIDLIDSIILLFLFPIGFSIAPFNVFGIDSMPVAVSDLAMGVFCLRVVWRAISGAQPLQFRLDVPTVSLIFVMAACLLSAVSPLLSGSSEYLRQFMKSTLHFSYMWLFTLLCCSVRTTFESVVNVFRVFVLCAIPVNIFGIYQVPARAFDWPYAWIEYTGASQKFTEQLSLEFEGFFRATSLFSEPSAFAMYTMTAAIILLAPYFLFDYRIIKNKIVFYTALYSCFIGMFLTFSLTIVVQLGAFLVAVVLISQSLTAKKLVTMLSVMTVVFWFTNAAIQTYSGADLFDLYFRRVASNIVGEDKVEATYGDSFGTRADAQRAAVRIWKNQPVFGAGLGCLGYAQDNEGLVGVSAHQMYLFVLASSGTVAGVALIIYSFGFSWVLMRRLVRNRRGFIRGSTPLVADVAMAIAAFLCCNEAVHGLSSDDFIMPYHWIVMGLVTLVYYHPGIRKDTNDQFLFFGMPARLGTHHSTIAQVQSGKE
jgi:hypothetical protein